MKEEEEELVYNYEGELLDEAIGLKGMHDAILKKMDTVFNKDQEGKKSSEIYPLIINTFTKEELAFLFLAMSTNIRSNK